MKKRTAAISQAIMVIIALIFLWVPQRAMSQETSSQVKVGMTASLQDNQFDILMPIRTSAVFVIAPAVSFFSVEDAGTDVRIGIVPRFYFRNTKVSPFIGARFGALVNSPKTGDSTSDFILGIEAGPEYFFDEQFSIGMEGQLNLSISDKKSNRFGNPGGTNINTATAIYATIYF